MENYGKYLAILLIGPTGSSKTPLGILLETLGMLNKKCVHFDFGAQLRQIADLNVCPDFLVQWEFNAIKSVLESGNLLSDEQFTIARKILNEFCRKRSIDDNTLLILNGLPRHYGQAEAISPIIDVGIIISLECSVEVVFRRISSDIGGDRAGRRDDNLTDVAKKLALFQERTAPLLDYYRSQGKTIISLPVATETTAQRLWESLSQQTELIRWFCQTAK